MGPYPRTFVIKAKYIPASAHQTTHTHTHTHITVQSCFHPHLQPPCEFLDEEFRRLRDSFLLALSFCCRCGSSGDGEEWSNTHTGADTCCTQCILMSAEIMWWCCPAVFLHSLGVSIKEFTSLSSFPCFSSTSFSLPHPYCVQHLSHF